MKYIWEESDIESGVRYTRKGIGEVWMIGYLADRDDKRYVSISLADGMVIPPKPAKEIAESLTADQYEPTP